MGFRSIEGFDTPVITGAITPTSLAGLNAVNGTPLGSSPTLNTTIAFSTTADQNPVAQTCATILPLTQDTLISTYKLQDASTPGGFLKTLDSFRIGLVNADQNQDVSNLPGGPQTLAYLNDLEVRQVPVLELVQNCLQERYTYDESALQAQKEATEEAKTRLTQIKNPERATSYYEGWFPIFRPMQETTLFALFGVAMAALVFSIYLFLRMSDVEFNVSFGGPGSDFLASLPSIGEFGPYVAGGLVVGVAGAALIYRYA